MYAGFDIGGTTARGKLFDAEWRMVATARTRVRGRTAPERITRIVTSLLEQLLAESGSETLDVVGVGLAAQLGADRKIVRNSPNLGWRDEPFAERIEDAVRERFGPTPVRLANDLNAILWGERTEGALPGAEDALAVFVGTGVGGAALVGGTLLRGADGVAGEIGHAKIEPGGRLCGCGERGCIEAYAGGVHLEQRVQHLADEHAELEELVDAEGEVDLGAADERARSHDELGEIWQRATDGLAVVTANACTFLNPEVLLTGGGVLEHCPYYREEFLTKFPSLILDAARDAIDVRSPSLGDEAGVRGAARLAALSYSD